MAYHNIDLVEHQKILTNTFTPSSQVNLLEDQDNPKTTSKSEWGGNDSEKEEVSKDNSAEYKIKIWAPEYEVRREIKGTPYLKSKKKVEVQPVQPKKSYYRSLTEGEKHTKVLKEVKVLYKYLILI